MSALTAVSLAVAEDGGEQAVVAGDAEQREADDEQAGDGATAEGSRQRRGDAPAGGLGDARVGAHGDVHADVAGRPGEHAADRRSRRRRRCSGWG